MAKGNSKGNKGSKSKSPSGKGGGGSEKSKGLLGGKRGSLDDKSSPTKGASGGDRRSSHESSGNPMSPGSSVDKPNGMSLGQPGGACDKSNGAVSGRDGEQSRSGRDGVHSPRGAKLMAEGRQPSRNGHGEVMNHVGESGSSNDSSPSKSVSMSASDGTTSPTSPKSNKSSASGSSISTLFNRLTKVRNPESTVTTFPADPPAPVHNGTPDVARGAAGPGSPRAGPPLDVAVTVVNGSSGGIAIPGSSRPYQSSSVPGSPLPSYKPPIPGAAAAATPTSYHSNKPEHPNKYSIIHSEPSSPYPTRPSGLAESLSRPSSALSMATVISAVSPDSVAGRDRIKMTVGEIVQQIEAKSNSLLQHEDFTKAETLADLHFLAQQSRYNSDMHIKRKLVNKMVENGVLEIFIKVRQSAMTSDYLAALTSFMETVEAETADSNSLSVDFTKDDTKDDLHDDGDTSSISEIEGNRKAKEKIRHVPDSVKNFRSIVTTLANVTERSSSLCEECIRKGLISLLLTDLSDNRLAVPELKDPNKMYIVKGYLGILGNMVRFHSDARDMYRDAGAVKVLQHFLKSNLLFVKMRTIMLLSYIINESENDIINASDKSITLLLKVLQSAVEADNHYSKKYGYWAVEVLAGLNRLCAFESNKERVVQRTGLPLYVRLLDLRCSEEEQLLAAHGLWILAFLSANRRPIRDEPGCIQALEALCHRAQRDEIKRTAKGALWVVLDRGIAFKSASMPAGACSRDLIAQSIGHVMLSYQWSTKASVHRIKERLKAAGFKVWMDIESTEDHQRATLETMSDAVDKSSVVLICMTQKYKDSPSCRTECEFAHRLKKDTIPLRIQPRYNPDGWLGKLVGTKLSFDFSRDENMETMMANLVRDLGNRGRIRPMEQYDVAASRSTLWASQTSLVVPAPDNFSKIVQWSSDDVMKWLAENGLHTVRDRFKAINGELLCEIRKMQRQAPEHFYATLKTELGFDFIMVLKFTKALDRL